MSDRHAAPNISIASLDGDRKEPFRRSLFSIPGQARDAVAKPISSKGSAAPLKKRQVRLTSIEDNNHARPLVTYHEDPPLNETWSPIPFQTSPEEEEGMIMSGVMEDFKCLMDGVFLEAKELPKLDSPSDIDVICPKGGGKKVLSHPGNKYYSKLIEEAVLAHICDKPDEDPNIFDVVSETQESTFFGCPRLIFCFLTFIFGAVFFFSGYSCKNHRQADSEPKQQIPIQRLKGKFDMA
jgi:hypothetical protein